MAEYNRSLMRKLRRPLFEKYEGKCCYCAEPVIFRSFISAEDLVSDEADWLVYRIDGVETRTRKASLDHWREVSVGGATAAHNLVLSCVECNRDRAPQRLNGTRPPRRICSHCRMPISRSRKYCRRCSRKSTATNRKPMQHKKRKKS